MVDVIISLKSGGIWLKNLINIIILLMLVGCTQQSEQVKKPNVHLYVFEGISIRAIVSKDNYQDIEILEITQIETGLKNDEERLLDLENERQAIENLVLTIESANLVLEHRDPDEWDIDKFINVRLSPEVMEDDLNSTVFIVKYVVDLTHEAMSKQCCGYQEVMEHFQLQNAIVEGKLTLDRFVNNNEFVFNEILVAENGLYIQQILD